MRFRALPILLIVAVLASQLARTPHAHVGMGPAEQSEHDQTPHIHPAGHGHSHSHGHSHEHDQNSGESEAPANDAFDAAHDSHGLAIAVDISPATTQINSVELDQSFSLAVVGYLADGGDGQSKIVRCHRPPDLSIFDGSDTYLKLRQLRI